MLHKLCFSLKKVWHFITVDIPLFFKIDLPLFISDCSLGTKLALICFCGLFCYLMVFFIFIGTIKLINSKPYQYELTYPVARITSIEIIYTPEDDSDWQNAYTNAVTLATVNACDHDKFLTDFTQIPCTRSSYEPTIWIGKEAIRITYDDGHIELICPYTSVYFDPEHTEACDYQVYGFDKDAFLKLLTDYGYSGPLQ